MGQSGFDMKKLSMGSKGILISAGVLFIALFLPWNRACVDFGAGKTCFGSINGWSGLGFLAGLLVIAVLVWEGLNAAGALANVSAPKAMIGAVLAGATALFAIIRFFQALSGLSIGSILGILAALALAYYAWVRFSESKTAGGGATMPPAAPPMG